MPNFVSILPGAKGRTSWIMTWDIGLLAGGLILLFAGGEALVRGSVAIAERLQISKLVVGMVIVGFGTSAPELLVSVKAAMAGSPAIAIGNIVGSNIANILLIIGLAAAIAPVDNKDKSIRREALIMVGCSLALLAMMLDGAISSAEGVAMLLALAGYLAMTYHLEKKRRDNAFTHEANAVAGAGFSLPIAAATALAGLFMLVYGADLMVAGATSVARNVGVSEAVIGLTIVAVGTSLPELATALVAAWRRQSEVVLANIVGSNIFNILAILGITAVIAPVPVAARFAAVDTPVMIGVALVLAILLYTADRLGRKTAAGLLLGYTVYLGSQNLIAG